MVEKLNAAGLIALLWTGAAFAHHSVSVNFDSAKALTLTGRIDELDIRNPHSRITLQVTQLDGKVKEWVIEWSDRNSLVRRKVPFELLHVGVPDKFVPHGSQDVLRKVLGLDAESLFFRFRTFFARAAAAAPAPAKPKSASPGGAA